MAMQERVRERLRVAGQDLPDFRDEDPAYWPEVRVRLRAASRAPAPWLALPWAWAAAAAVVAVVIGYLLSAQGPRPSGPAVVARQQSAPAAPEVQAPSATEQGVASSQPKSPGPSDVASAPVRDRGPSVDMRLVGVRSSGKPAHATVHPSRPADRNGEDQIIEF
jgi:hypothetical protein